MLHPALLGFCPVRSSLWGEHTMEVICRYARDWREDLFGIHSLPSIVCCARLKIAELGPGKCFGNWGMILDCMHLLPFWVRFERLQGTIKCRVANGKTWHRWYNINSVSLRLYCSSWGSWNSCIKTCRRINAMGLIQCLREFCIAALLSQMQQ